MNSQNRRAYTYALIVVLFWSTIASAFKIALRHLDFLQLTFYAALFSTVILFSIMVIQNKVILLKTLSRKDILSSAGLGLLNPLIYYIVLLKAYSLLPAQVAQPLNYTWPIALVVLSIFLLGQRIRGRDILSVSVGYLGVLIISSRGAWFDPALIRIDGVILALISTVIWAFFWIFNIRDQRDEVVKLFLNFFFGSGYLLCVLLGFSRLSIPSLAGVLSALYVGAFEMGITFVLWLKALRLARNTALVSNLIYCAPFLSLVIINFVLAEPIIPTTVIGLILVVTGIIIQRAGRRNSLPGD